MKYTVTSRLIENDYSAIVVSDMAITNPTSLQNARKQAAEFKRHIIKQQKQGNLQDVRYTWLTAPSTIRERDFDSYTGITFLRAHWIKERVTVIYFIRQVS